LEAVTVLQFSLKRLFVSVTLFAVGAACLLWFRETQRPWHAFAALCLSAVCFSVAIAALSVKRKPRA
jgi:hypothetical protein